MKRLSRKMTQHLASHTFASRIDKGFTLNCSAAHCSVQRRGRRTHSFSDIRHYSKINGEIHSKMDTYPEGN